MSDLFGELEIEQDAAAEPQVVQDVNGNDLALVHALPPTFPLLTLLRFLPDVRLKARADAAAAAALAIDVAADGGLVQADAAFAPVRTEIAEIELRFDGTKAEPGPTMLAHQLHARLTGLRGDFVASAKAAIETVSRRIY